jgi:hypothetical protein
MPRAARLMFSQQRFRGLRQRVTRNAGYSCFNRMETSRYSKRKRGPGVQRGLRFLDRPADMKRCAREDGAF